MRRTLIALGVIFVALVVVPPILASIFGWNDFSDSLPEPGERVVLSSGEYVNVVDAGQGPPVVLVHGLPGSGYDWKPLPSELERRGCRVIRYDRVGYGYSSRRDSLDEYTLEANARNLLALLDALGLDRATLVGWSYGGGVIQLAATLRPESVNGLVLVGSIGPTYQPSEPSLVERILFSKPVARWSFAVGLPARANTAQISAAAFSPDEIAPWWVDQTVALMALPGAFESLRAEDVRMDGSVLAPEKIETRTIVSQGTEDAFVPLAVAEDLHQRIRGSEIVTIPHGSHMLPVTHPTELADRISGLAGCSAAAEEDNRV